MRTVHCSVQNLFQANMYFVPCNARQIPPEDAGPGGLQVEVGFVQQRGMLSV